MVAAGRLVEDTVAAVDINLGCPQGIARRGYYGAYLLEEPDLIVSMVSAMHQNLHTIDFDQLQQLLLLLLLPPHQQQQQQQQSGSWIGRARRPCCWLMRWKLRVLLQ
ncbi:hypothetical protein ACSSS7_005554 [Eimeria intestinalis]